MTPAPRNHLFAFGCSTRCVVALCWALSIAKALAVAAIVRDFNGPDTSWQLLDNGVPAHILAQAVLPGGAQDHGGAERLEVAAPVGRSAFLVCPIEPTSVMDELEVKIWTNSNRPGVQLAVRVVLPRSIDPKTKLAATTIVRGERYNRLGHWQQLNLSGVPKLLADEVRVMRTDAGFSIDPRQAYVDAIVLVVPGQPEGTLVSTDNLEITGIQIEPTTIAQASQAAIGENKNVRHSSVEQADWQQDVGPAAKGDPQLTPHQVRLIGATLLVEGKPFMPRAIEWRGESLQFLYDRGFNTIQLPKAPEVIQSTEAKKLGLWFICPPPLPDVIVKSGLGRAEDRVLAWYLDDSTGEIDPDYFRHRAELIRIHDAVSGRPVILASEVDWTNLSKAADIVAAGHPLVGQMSDAEYDEWIVGAARLAKTSAPLWASFTTQFGNKVAEQCTALGSAKAPPPTVDCERLDALVKIACTHACRGYLFRSTTSLNETDAATRLRAMSLELINRKLQLMEPWLAGGKVVGSLTSSDPNYSAVVLHVDRARLLLPMTQRSGDQKNPQSNAANFPTSAQKVWTIPGVPESSQAFSLSPAMMRPLDPTRVTGGTRVSLESKDNSMVILTEDPQVILTLRQRVTRSAPLAIRVERDLAAGRGARLAEDSRRLTQLGYNTGAVTQEIAAANALVRQCDSLLTMNRSDEAYQFAQQARGMLHRATEAERLLIVAPTQFGSYPLSAGDCFLSEHARFIRSLDALRGGENLLYGGDFEDLGQLNQFGWQHVSHPTPGVNTQAELSTIEPQHGKLCVRLSAKSADAKDAPAIASAPVWIVSPSIHLVPNQVMEITGWVRVSEPIHGSIGGLQIVDSIGGAELSLSVLHTEGWQPFQMIRAVPQETDLRLTFALTGLGTADLDALMIRPLKQPIARRLPAVAVRGISTQKNDTADEGPLFVSPQSR